jgi:hypothetical protein
VDIARQHRPRPVIFGDHVEAVIGEGGVAGAVDEGEPAERVVAQRGPGRAGGPQRIVGGPVGVALAGRRVRGEISPGVVGGGAAADRAQAVEAVGHARRRSAAMAGPGIGGVGAGAAEDLRDRIIGQGDRLVVAGARRLLGERLKPRDRIIAIVGHRAVAAGQRLRAAELMHLVNCHRNSRNSVTLIHRNSQMSNCASNWGLLQLSSLIADMVGVEKSKHYSH